MPLENIDPASHEGRMVQVDREKQKLYKLLRQKEELAKYGGHLYKIFPSEGPLSIDNYPRHKELINATQIYNELCFFGGNRTGKALWNDEKVCTPSGFTKMKNLKVGDLVVGSDGKPTKIIGVYPQGTRPSYKVTISDGASLVCDEDHLWKVRDTSKGAGGKYKIKTTKELIKSKKRWALPKRPCVEHLEQDLPIHPYLLGLLIGDGGLTNNSVMITTADEEIANYCKRVAPDYGCELIKRGRYAYHFKSQRNNRHGNSYNLLKDILDGLGLNKTSHGKFIPAEYLVSSKSQRIALLQGLMDTDGYCGKNGHSEFYSVSTALAGDVCQLVRSLGVGSSIRRKHGQYKGKPHLSWIVPVRRTSRFTPFRLTRKKERYKSSVVAKKGLCIDSIEFVGNLPCTCITVSNEDGLFLAGDFVVTHNSQLGAYLTACHLTGDYPEWFEGRKFDGPIEAWAAGDTAQTTRDVVQRELVGPPGGIGTGMLARDSILRTTSKSGVPDGLDTVWVKHKSGGTSRLGLKSYDQKRRSFQGTARHWAWLDEECPHDVYEECLMRTMTTNGIILVTFTPIQGLTKFVVDFMDAAEDHST